jgi:hypothetical protein
MKGENTLLSHSPPSVPLAIRIKVRQSLWQRWGLCSRDWQTSFTPRLRCGRSIHWVGRYPLGGSGLPTSRSRPARRYRHGRFSCHCLADRPRLPIRSRWNVSHLRISNLRSPVRFYLLFRRRFGALPQSLMRAKYESKIITSPAEKKHNEPRAPGG